MSTALTLISIAMVVLVLARDWGHRRATLFALLRPLLAVLVVPFVMPGWDFTGNGLLLEIAAIAVGALLGVFSNLFMRVSVDGEGRMWTDAGIGYAAVWVAVAAARQLFIYGCQHWFQRDIGMFLYNQHISVNGFADAIMFLTLATVVTNRLAILTRGRRTAPVSATAPALS